MQGAPRWDSCVAVAVRVEGVLRTTSALCGQGGRRSSSWRGVLMPRSDAEEDGVFQK